MDKENKARRVHILRDNVARKIAAGEVIDRPFSVVRELIDNSLDAKSSEISLSIENGGMSRIRVVDNGSGMTREDLELCFLPHATSKIDDVEDIYTISTLGFRGEALSAISTCSQLEITSAVPEAPYGHRLVVHGGKLISLEEFKSKQGTIVDISSLFYNMPGRKKFLKSISGESSKCTSTFIEKTLPFPEVLFKLTTNEKMKLMLPPATLLKRVVTVFRDLAPEHAFEYITDSGDGFSIDIVAARPEIQKKDKRYIQIFINKRRVFEYACIQAVEYGFSGYIPGNNHPVACVFITIDPALVDFNIHPAKKECKIRILPQIHQCIVSMIKSFVNKFSITTATPGMSYHEQTNQPFFSESSFKKAVKEPSYTYPSLHDQKTGITSPLTHPEIGTEADTTSHQPLYLGQVFGLFLVVEYNDNIYIIDQHAAHERLLYEELKRKPPVMQELLFPVSFDVTEKEAEHITQLLPSLLKQGISIEKAGHCCYEITALPAHFQSIDSKEIVIFLKTSAGQVDKLDHQLNSMAACRNAIKDGDTIDHLTAENLIHRVFQLENARCPHGRPIWHVISKDQLFKFMGRT